MEQIEHQFIPVTLDSKLDALVDLLRESDGVSLVFVRTKRGADRLAEPSCSERGAAGRWRCTAT